MQTVPEPAERAGNRNACALVALLLGGAAAASWKAGLPLVMDACITVAATLAIMAITLTVAPLLATRADRADPAPAAPPPPSRAGPAPLRGEEQSRTANPFNQVA